MEFLKQLLRKNLTTLIALCGALFLFANNAHAEPTVWKPLNKSLATLLDEGWRIVSMNDMQWMKEEISISRTFWAALPDGRVFSFMLEKSGKFIVCMVQDPHPNSASSECRQLN